jgi:RNA 2',3'-cyclic 3'-phosphodiesterase
MNDPNHAELIRTFVCIDISESIKERIAALQDELRRLDAQVSWVRPANIHLTLKFLGDVAKARIPQVIQAVQHTTGSCSPFQVEVQGTGCFPSPRRPSVLWIGLKEIPEALARLHRTIEDELAKAGFAREAKPFNPHLTIGRIRNPRNASVLAESLIKRGFEGESFSAHEVIVMKSQLDPRGATYTPQAVLAITP